MARMPLPMRVCGTLRAMLRCGVGSRLGLKGQHFFRHDQMTLAQHVSQHMIGFQLQVVGPQLQRHMPVAQVIGRTQQVKGRPVLGAMAHHQHRLRRSIHADETAVFGHQHITTPHHRASWQKNGQGAACTVCRVKAALAAQVPVQCHVVGTLDEHGSQAARLTNDFVDGQHGEVRSLAWGV